MLSLHPLHRLVLLRSISTSPRPWRADQDIRTPKQLYKHLIKETRKLPEDAGKFYKDSIKRGFSQHLDETDPERIKQIIERAVEDAKWVVDKQFSSNASGPLRQDVLRLYKRLLRLSQTWQAKDPNETTTERNYIQDETKRLFRENQNVQSPQRISEHIREAEARLTMAEHYRNPYPRPVNLPKTSFAKREGQRSGKAIEKLNKMSKPIYMKSLDDTLKGEDRNSS